MLNLYELAQTIGESFEVKVKDDKFILQFKNCEIKEYKQSRILTICPRGVGDTVEQAADKLFKLINGKWLVFGADRMNRREYSATIYQSQCDDSFYTMWTDEK